MGATLGRAAGRRAPVHGRVALPLLVVALLLVGATSFAQDPAPLTAVRPHASTPNDDAPDDGAARRAAKFLLGGAAGLGLHEGGHVLFDGLFGVKPTLKKVDFGGIPFFAITHRSGLPPRQEFTITSAGFWMQHLSSEIILARHPRLRDERAPALKGMLAFNVLASVAYGMAAMAKAGPVERDTRAMAAALRVNEAWVGGLVLAPAGLDGWRYFHPDARWATWVSRGVKIGMVLLVLR
jgi:hypothetical protein